MSGWSELGAMLGGGAQLKQQAYQLGAETGARQAGLLEQARQRRDQNLGLQAITPQAVSSVVSGTDPVTGQPFDPAAMNALQGELVSAMFHAKLDPRQLSGYQKDEQGIGFKRDAMTAALDPTVGLDSLNRRLMVINGKPVDLTHVADGVAFNPMVDPHSQTIDPTQVGLADIMLRGAQAAQANAGAREHDAQTRLADTKTAAGGFAPDHGATKPSLPPISALGAVLGQGYDKATGLVTIPEDKMQAFVTWQAKKAESDPRYNNGAFALQHYPSEAPLGTGMHDSPDDVGASLTTMLNLHRGAAAPAKASTAAPAATAHKAVAPTPGTTEDGYIFKGGDPSKPENWVKADTLREAAQ